MSKDQEIKIIPPKTTRNIKQRRTKRPNYIAWLVGLIGIYFALLITIALLPLSGCMEVLSLFLGTFILLDVLHSIKYYVKNKQQTT